MTQQYKTMKRLALETLIQQREAALDEAADAYGALAEHFELRECEQEPDDACALTCRWSDEYRAAERKFDRLTDDCVSLARECVPVLTIFALPAWLRERIGEAVPVRY